jgi:hypothetical protein
LGNTSLSYLEVEAVLMLFTIKLIKSKPH